MAVVCKREEQLGYAGWTLEEYARFQLGEIEDDLFENVGVEYEETEPQLKQVLMMMLQIMNERENKQSKEEAEDDGSV